MQIEQPTKKYMHDHSIVYSCQYHVVFCPKYRRPVLVNGVDERLKQLVREKQSEYGYEVIDVEVMPDHVHMLISIDPRLVPSDVVGKIKGYTAHQLREEFTWLKSRLPSLWTRSKFISTCGAVSLEIVKQYIENQKNV